MRNWHVLKIRGAIDRFDEKKELLENLESFFDSLNDTRDRIDNPASISQFRISAVTGDTDRVRLSWERSRSIQFDWWGAWNRGWDEEGTRKFFLSFFWRGIIGTVSCQLASRKSIGRFSALFAQGSSRITREKHLLPCKSILASARLILNLSQILLSSFLLPPPTFLYLISFSFSSLKRNYTGW